MIVNTTVSVDEETCRNARRKAAERNTSVSRLVEVFLRSLRIEDELRAERRRRLEQVFHEADPQAELRAVGVFDRREIYD